MDTDAHSGVQRVAATMDIQAGKVAEYKAVHDAQWPEVRAALQSVGLSNLSLWTAGSRLFYYAEFRSTNGESLEQAMARYAAMPRVAEWEELMHTMQQQLPGSPPGVWWQPMEELFWQS